MRNLYWATHEMMVMTQRLILASVVLSETRKVENIVDKKDIRVTGMALERMRSDSLRMHSLHCTVCRNPRVSQYSELKAFSAEI